MRLLNRASPLSVIELVAAIAFFGGILTGLYIGLGPTDPTLAPTAIAVSFPIKTAPVNAKHLELTLTSQGDASAFAAASQVDQEPPITSEDLPDPALVNQAIRDAQHLASQPQIDWSTPPPRIESHIADRPLGRTFDEVRQNPQLQKALEAKVTTLPIAARYAIYMATLLRSCSNDSNGANSAPGTSP